MHVEDVEALTTWLVRELKPICDAEPAVLAKYVLSLIRKPDKTDEEIRVFCVEQLEVFLQGNNKRFVEKMFAVLKDGSYMENPATTKVEKKLDVPDVKKALPALVKDVKNDEIAAKIEEPKPTTSREVKVEDNTRRVVVVRKNDPPKKDEPAKATRKRISPPPSEAKKEATRERDAVRRRSRSPRNRRTRRSPEMTRRYGRRNSRSRSRSVDREKRDRKSEDDRRKKRCRDYDELGYCTRGDMCHFDHGPDPVVVDRNVVDKMGGSIVKGHATPNLSIPPPGYNPVNPPPPGVEGTFSAPGAAPAVEGYNPEAPAMGNFSVPPPPLPLHISGQWRPPAYSVTPVPMGVSIYEPSSGVPIDPSSATPAVRGGATFRGRGRGAATQPRFNATPRNSDGKTLLVRKIPTEQNTITKLNEHFSQFGNIVNIQVRYNEEPESALVTFSCRMEATNAIKSPSPVLNNRFISVVWYNPDFDKNATEKRTLSSGVNVNKPQALPVEIPPKPKVASYTEAKLFGNNYANARENIRKKKELQEKSRALLETQKKQAMLIDTLIKQQKKILTKIREGGDAETKKRLHAMAKETSTQITVARESMESVRKQLQDTASAIKELSTDSEKSTEDSEVNGNGVVVGSKRNATAAGFDTEDVGGKKKMMNAILITGFTMEEEEKVAEAMESFGELIDVEIQPGTGPEISAVYVYKERTIAEKVLEKGVSVNEKQLVVSWMEDKSTRGQENKYQSS